MTSCGWRRLWAIISAGLVLFSGRTRCQTLVAGSLPTFRQILSVPIPKDTRQPLADDPPLPPLTLTAVSLSRWQAFAGFCEVVQGSRKLRQALTDVLGGPSFRTISRNEIYIGTAAAWHMDWMHGPLVRYATERAQPILHPQSTLARNETMKIATVAIYLQSHAAADNLNALTVRPGLHRCADPHQPIPAGAARCKLDARGSDETKKGMTLHPDIGDVVVFDARLPHRGQDKRFADAVRNSSLPMLIHASARADGHGHRAMLSMQFGRNNDFSERMDRAFKIRNAVYNNESVCGMPLTTNRVLTSKSLRQKAASFSAPCITRAIEEDLRRRPLAPLNYR